MTLSNDLNSIQKQSPDQLRSNAYRERLKTAKIDDKVVDKLLADDKLGGKEDVTFLENRQKDEKVPAESKTAERGLLSALNSLETDNKTNTSTAPQAKPWNDSSVYKSPGRDLESVRKGDVTLQKGHGGPAVGEVQQMLDDAGYPDNKYGVDQRYGPATEARVRQFQKDNKLDETGQVDKTTLGKLDEVVKAKKEPKADNKQAADAVNQAIEQFDSISENGVVSADKLSKVKGGDVLAKNVDSLMFANIDKGPNAWHGLTKKDLQIVQKRLANGESINDIAKDTRTKSHVGRELAKTKPNFTQKDFSDAVDQHQNRNAVSDTVEQFDKIAKDGFVSKEALAKIPGGKAIAEKFDALIFGSIDPSNAAWNGLSKKDLQAIQTRLSKGEPLDDIAMDLMKNNHVGKELSGKFTYEEFAKAVEQKRAALK